MGERFIDAFLDKLVLLERSTGARVGYEILVPTVVNSYDHLSIQHQAKEIAAFAGLHDITFVIAIARQSENTGGRIDLSDNDKCVFVEVDDRMKEFPASITSTLCHEITHKWLQLNRIASQVQIDNEILTDIAAVFLGFGKVMLNGCRSSSTRTEVTLDGSREITESLRVGYLDRDQLALVYCLVCAMRKIHLSDSIRGLRPEAATAVRRCYAQYGNTYNQRYHKKETSHQAVDSFSDLLFEVKNRLAAVDKHVAYVRKAFCDTTEQLLRERHETLESLRRKAESMTDQNAPDPALRFLYAIQNNLELERYVDQAGAIQSESEGFLNHAKTIGAHLAGDTGRFPQPSSDMFNIIVCPMDGTRLRLPEDCGDLMVTCTRCNYRFPYNTRTISFPERVVETSKGGIMTRIAALFRRRNCG